MAEGGLPARILDRRSTEGHGKKTPDPFYFVPFYFMPRLTVPLRSECSSPGDVFARGELGSFLDLALRPLLRCPPMARQLRLEFEGALYHVTPRAKDGARTLL